MDSLNKNLLLSMNKHYIYKFNQINYKKKFYKYLLKFLIILIFLFYCFYTKLKHLFKNIFIKNKDIKVCLCIMGKEENIYAKEYIAHYKKLGYNHIFLYDNNDINGEKFEKILIDEINDDFVTILNFRGKKGKKGKRGGIQLEIYYHCYEKNNKEYDWLSFFDFDEFLEIRPKGESIQNFLSNKRYKTCETIKINFLHYSDNEYLFYFNNSVQERFTTPLYNNINNKVVKSIIKGSLKENYWKRSNCAHTSLMKYITCNSLGQKIKYNSFIIPFNYTYAYLKHYMTKSVEEYCNKVRRGEAFFNYLQFNEKRKQFKINKYFKFNKKTNNKIILFKLLFSIK